MTHATLPELIAAAKANTAQARAELGGLSSEQLNWKPGPERWSVGQCLDHLLTANAAYFPIFDAILEGSQKRSFWEKLPGLPRLWGRMLVRSVSPDSKPRLKAPEIFQPALSEIADDILSRFVEQQERVIRYLEAAAGLDAERIILTSPVSRLITYSLLDALRVIVAHEQRHLAQARRVTESPGFPGRPA